MLSPLHRFLLPLAVLALGVCCTCLLYTSLRPIMMTALVACLGLLPAALSTGIGSDTQKPFAIVIVAGLISRLFIGFFVNPVLYQMVAREGDVLQV